MPVTINGTTGVAGADGSAATPAYQGGDTNTGIFFPAADTIAFAEGGVEAMRIDSSGNVQIGTSSGSFTNGSGLIIANSTAARLKLADSDSGVGAADGFELIAAGSDSYVYNYENGFMSFGTAATERMRIDSSGNVGIGTSSPEAVTNYKTLELQGGTTNTGGIFQSTTSDNSVKARLFTNNNGGLINVVTNHSLLLFTNNTERARITSGGDVAIGTTDSAATRLAASSGNGTVIQGASYSVFSRNADASAQAVMAINTTGVDSKLIVFYAQGTEEGNISVSGTTVSYNGGHLARWSQLLDNSKDDTILKGTVMSNLDEMNQYVDADGNPVENEQLNKVKVSDVEGDVNVAGVFVNWSHDEAHNVDEINMAMTGDMIIRIAQGVVVQKGDLLMSAGDGTAKPQGDDIVRSKTVAKVTSNHVTCTYADGSYCVPCVLMAC